MTDTAGSSSAPEAAVGSQTTCAKTFLKSSTAGCCQALGDPASCLSSHRPDVLLGIPDLERQSGDVEVVLGQRSVGVSFESESNGDRRDNRSRSASRSLSWCEEVHDIDADKSKPTNREETCRSKRRDQGVSEGGAAGGDVDVEAGADVNVDVDIDVDMYVDDLEVPKVISSCSTISSSMDAKSIDESEEQLMESGAIAPVQLHRVVPLLVQRSLAVILSLANALTFISVAVHGDSFYATMWSLFAVVTLVPGALALVDGLRKRPERRGFLGVWASVLVTMNARAYCWAEWGSEGKAGWQQYNIAWPAVKPCWYLAYLWALWVLLQHLYLPARRTCCRLSQMKRYAALAYGWFLLLLFVLYRSPDDGMVPSARLGFLRDQSQTLLPIFSLLLSEMVHLLETGDGAGVRAILLFPPVLWAVPLQLYGSEWIYWGLEQPIRQPAVILFALLGAWSMLLHSASARNTPKIQSTSPMYREVNWDELRGWRGSLLTLKYSFSTWRGANVVFMMNGLVTLLGYGFTREELSRNLRGTLHDSYADGQGKWYSGAHIVDTLLFTSAWTILVAAVNLFEDSWTGCGKQVGRSFLSCLPYDRHFRFLTLLKVVMLWLKMELLVFTCFRCEEDSMTLTLVIFQITSIVLTSLVSCWSSLQLAVIAKRLEQNLKGLYRFPKVLWSSAAFALVVLTGVNAVMMTCKFLGHDNALIRVLHGKGCVGILLNLGQTFYVPFFCLGNEAALSISSKASFPKVFAGLHSPRGVWALATWAAAKFPVEIIVNCVECQFLLPSYISSMFLFTESWVEPMYGYSTVLLIIAGIAAYISCGGDGWERDDDACSSSDNGGQTAGQPSTLSRAASRASKASALSGFSSVF